MKRYTNIHTHPDVIIKIASENLKISGSAIAYFKIKALVLLYALKHYYNRIPRIIQQSNKRRD